MKKKYLFGLILAFFAMGSMMAQTYTLKSAQRDYSRGNEYYAQKDYVIAAALYKKAADYGYDRAQNNLGWCYQHGLGVEKDYTKAAQWYRKSATQGYAKAQNNLGYCYEHGYGVKQDYGMASEWYKMALGKSRNAQKNLNRVNRTNGITTSTSSEGSLTPKGSYTDEDADEDLAYGILAYLFEAYDEALPYLQRSANYGNADAQYLLGSYYYAGHDGQPDYKKAVELFRKSAEQNNANAQTMLGLCYTLGNGVEENPSLAVEWTRKGANQDQASAQTMMGTFYENGYGVTEDVTTAVSWYRKAARQDKQEAQEALTRLGYSW